MHYASATISCSPGSYLIKGSSSCTECEKGYFCDGKHSGGIVNGFTKISDTQGGFGPILSDNDRFGGCNTQLDDLDGDGIKVIIFL